MKLVRILLWVQGGYTLVTALWPLLDIVSFMEVTGYKTDIWLVKTVGALLLPVSLCYGMFLLFDTDYRPAVALGAGTATAFIVIDFYYALTDTISDIYLADGVLQIVFLISWMYVLSRFRTLLKAP